MKKLLSAFLAILLLLSLLPTICAAEAPVVILLGSDFQNNCYNPHYDRFLYDDVPIEDQPRSRQLQALLQSVADAGILPDAALFAGDYTDHFQADENGPDCAGEGIAYIRQLLNASFGEDYTESHRTIFAQGNHDYEGVPELAPSGLQPYNDEDSYLVYVINEKDFPYNQVDANAEETVKATAQRVQEDLSELAEAGEVRPILVLCHVPLHYSTRYDGDDNAYANLIFEPLNQAAATLNMIVIFGHNHSGASADYEASWGGAVNYVEKGQTLDVNFDGHKRSETNPHVLNFTYMNAGYVGYSNSVTNSTRLLSLLHIYDNRITVSRYSTDGEYTAVESLGQTNPSAPEDGPVTNYPITFLLHPETDYTVTAYNETPLYGIVQCVDNVVTVNAFENYALLDWRLEPENAATVSQDGNKLYFSDLTSDCKIFFRFHEVFCVSEVFSDVDQSKWYHDGIDFVLQRGLFKGLSETDFAPMDNMTRAMVVTVLYRLEGSPALASGTVFSDVPENTWYSKPVLWANVTGIVKGVSENCFAPNDAVTREQLATITYRYAAYHKYPTQTQGSLETYRDAASVSAYAKKPMAWAVEYGLISGMGNQTLMPQGFAVRAQVAAILQRFCHAFRSTT